MNDNRVLAVREPYALATTVEERRALIKQQLCPKASDVELEYFLQTARVLGLSPFAKEIYATMRSNNVKDATGKWVTEQKMVIQVGIDGYRAIGARTGGFGGMNGPWWCGEDGVWRDTWFKEKMGYPAAAKVEIVLTATGKTVTGIANWDEFRQITPARKAGRDEKTGKTWDARPEKLADMWESHPTLMLAKCAEAQAWRKGLSGQTQFAQIEQRKVQFAVDEATPPDDDAPPLNDEDDLAAMDGVWSDPAPPPVTVSAPYEDDVATFANELEKVGWSPDEAKRAFGCDDLAAEAERRGGWAQMTLAVRAHVAKLMRAAVVDGSMPPIKQTEPASSLLWNQDVAPGTAAPAVPDPNAPMPMGDAIPRVDKAQPGLKL